VLGDGSVVVTGYTPLFGGSTFRGFVDLFPPGWLLAWRTQLPTRVMVAGILSLPDGSALLTSGLASVGGAPSGAARMLPGGTIVPASAGVLVSCARFFPNGDLLAGGWGLQRLRSTCDAVVVPGGAGCTGSGGANVLAATALPWIGSTYEARATGMPAVGLAVGLRSFTAGSVPLAVVLPQANPGCLLLVAPDVLDVYVPAGGVVRTRLPIPNVPALVGAVVHEQVVALEFAGSGLAVATSTNRLTMTVGSF